MANALYSLGSLVKTIHKRVNLCFRVGGDQQNIIVILAAQLIKRRVYGYDVAPRSAAHLIIADKNHFARKFAQLVLYGLIVHIHEHQLEIILAELFFAAPDHIAEVLNDLKEQLVVYDSVHRQKRYEVFACELQKPVLFHAHANYGVRRIYFGILQICAYDQVVAQSFKRVAEQP